MTTDPLAGVRPAPGAPHLDSPPSAAPSVAASVPSGATPAVPKAATISDVARAAGVSVGTVSRVLNGHADVTPALGEAVRAAVAQLGYRRNSAAAQLRRGSRITVALLVEDVADPFYSHLHRAVEEAALRNNWALLVASTSASAERTRTQIEVLASQGIHALIGALPHDLPVAELRAALEPRTPIVLVDRPEQLEADAVISNNRAAARQATEHLLDLGHERVACLLDRHALYTSEERAAGYRDAMSARGLAIDERLIAWRDSHWDPVGVLAAMLALDTPPTALFTGNNRVTVESLQAQRELGARLEQVGFDDVELAELLTPPLSVIAQDPSELGRVAAERVAARLAGDVGPSAVFTVPARLVVR